MEPFPTTFLFQLSWTRHRPVTVRNTGLCNYIIHYNLIKVKKLCKYRYILLLTSFETCCFYSGISRLEK